MVFTEDSIFILFGSDDAKLIIFIFEQEDLLDERSFGLPSTFLETLLQGLE
jgi:hypothetical protein